MAFVDRHAPDGKEKASRVPLTPHVQLSLQERRGIHKKSPAAFAPLTEMRALRLQRGVVAMPRVYPGRVGQRAEQALGHVGKQEVKSSGEFILPNIGA